MSQAPTEPPEGPKDGIDLEFTSGQRRPAALQFAGSWQPGEPRSRRPNYPSLSERLNATARTPRALSLSPAVRRRVRGQRHTRTEFTNAGSLARTMWTPTAGTVNSVQVQNVATATLLTASTRIQE